MIKKIEDYTGRKFLFICRACSKRNDEKKEFVFDHFQRVRGAVLRCCSCGFRIGRSRKLLDRQIEEQERRKHFMRIEEGEK